MSFKNTVCLVLGGGKSSRMGRDKASLRFAYKGREISLLEYLLETLQPLFSELYFCAKSEPVGLKCKFLQDKFEYFHPINALKTFADAALFPDWNSVFVIAVDFANIKRTYIKRMFYKHRRKKCAIIAKSAKSHYLCGFYKMSDFKHLKNLDENCRIRDFAKLAKAKTLSFKNDRIFININTFSDFENFLKLN